jgi:hypothetical protein
MDISSDLRALPGHPSGRPVFVRDWVRAAKNEPDFSTARSNRLCAAEDDPVLRIDVLKYVSKVVQLTMVQIVVQLKVDTKHPPLMRQLHSKVSELLLRSPVAERSSRAE